MKIKKFFPIVEVEKEIEFLNNQKNYKLVSVVNDTYVFEESPLVYYYQILINDEEVMESNEDVITIPSHYYKWIHYRLKDTPFDEVDFSGHVEIVEQVLRRWDRFTLVIASSLTVLSLYMWVQSRSVIYSLMFLAGIALFIVNVVYRSKYKNFVKKWNN